MTRYQRIALLARFSRITVWKRGGERAPHKPLLILYALARLQRGEPRLIPFSDIEHDLGTLLHDFGPPRPTRPEYPFWHLQSDNLWEIPQRDELQADVDGAPWRNNPRLTVIREANAQGGFPADLYSHLQRHPKQVQQIVAQILEDNFPPSLHDEILDAVGMPWVALTARRLRDPAFRGTILRIYEHRCAVCGYDGRLGSTDLGIEAAHVKWHSAGGPDSPDNGLALCTFHHKALDRGALGIADDHAILVSQEVHGSQRVAEMLIDFTGRPLRSPQPLQPLIEPSFSAWHRKQVFHGPPRAPAGG